MELSLRDIWLKNIKDRKAIPSNLLKCTVFVCIIIIIIGSRTWPLPFKARFFSNVFSRGAILHLAAKTSFTIYKGYLTKLHNSIEYTYLTSQKFKIYSTTISKLKDYKYKTHDLCLYPKKGSLFIIEILEDDPNRNKTPITIELGENNKPIPIEFDLEASRTKGEIVLYILRARGIKTLELNPSNKVKIILSNVMVKYGEEPPIEVNKREEICGCSMFNTLIMYQGPIDLPELEKYKIPIGKIEGFEKSRSENDEYIKMSFEKVEDDDHPVIEFKERKENIIQKLTMLEMKKGFIKIAGQESLIDVEKIDKLPSNGEISGYVTEIERFYILKDSLNTYLSGKTNSIKILDEEKLQTWLDYLLSHKWLSIIIGLVIIMLDKILTYMSQRE